MRKKSGSALYYTKYIIRRVLWQTAGGKFYKKLTMLQNSVCVVTLNELRRCKEIKNEKGSNYNVGTDAVDCCTVASKAADAVGIISVKLPQGWEAELLFAENGAQQLVLRDDGELGIVSIYCEGGTPYENLTD